MALLGNIQLLNRSPGRFLGGVSPSDNRSNFNGPGASRNFMFQDGATSAVETAAVPSGTAPPYSWVIQQNGNGFAAYSTAGTGEMSNNNLAMGIAGSAALTGTGELTTADLQLIAYLFAALTGTGTIAAQLNGLANCASTLAGTGELTTADLTALVAMAAALAGTGDVTSADLQLVVAMAAALSASGDVTAADMGMLAQLLADISASGTISATLDSMMVMAADLAASGNIVAAVTVIGHFTAALDAAATLAAGMTGYLSMTSSINVTGDLLTTANVASSVWGAIAANNNDAATMGEKLNDAGSASNPWTEVIESGYTAAEILKLLASVAVGKTDITGSTVTFKGVDGTTDRVVAGMTGSERTTVTLDPN